MKKYHVNAATGGVVPCGNISCPVEHFQAKEEAIAHQEAHHATLFHLQQERCPDPLFDKALEKAIAGGFVRASSDYPQHTEAQLSILLTPTGFSYMADNISASASDYLKTQHAKAVAWATTEFARLHHMDVKQAYRIFTEDKLRTKTAQARVLEELAHASYSTDDILKAAGNLWIYRDSPFHQRAKRLLFTDSFEVRGYEPQDVRTSEVAPHKTILSRMKVKARDLPKGVLAFDIETDTSRGFGLRPLLTQITEVVVSSREQSWIFAGDEKHILQEFTKLLNDQKEPVILAGWNNWCFDNIVLQTRAEHHDIEDWGGLLEEAVNSTVFEPVGPSSFAQAFIWVTPEGITLRDLDIFQEKVILDRARGERYTQGLKPFVESLGCEPVKVDRQRLHELSADERRNYVLSDGVSTLRAYTEVLRLQEVSQTLL